MNPNWISDDIKEYFVCWVREREKGMERRRGENVLWLFKSFNSYLLGIHTDEMFGSCFKIK